MISLNLKIILLTLKIATISTLLVTIVSVLLVWLLDRNNSKLKNIFEMLINLSLFISPSVLGYIFILILGKRGVVGAILYKYFDISVIFSWWAGIITAFIVTLPLMYNSVKTGMASLNPVYFEAGREAGASEFQILRLITLPVIKRNILAGMVLSFGRAMGEFGAVSVLSGHLRGKTNTLPLHVEILFNEFQYVPAFAVSSLLVIMAVIILVVRSLIEYKGKKEA